MSEMRSETTMPEIPVDCERALGLQMRALLDETLAAEESKVLVGHVAECVSCRTACECLAASDAMLREARPQPMPELVRSGARRAAAGRTP